jgi:hypothetical protein
LKDSLLQAAGVILKFKQIKIMGKYGKNIKKPINY